MFQRLWVWIPAPLMDGLLHIYLLKNCNDVCLKRPEINDKRLRRWPILKKLIERWKKVYLTRGGFVQYSYSVELVEMHPVLGQLAHTAKTIHFSEKTRFLNFLFSKFCRNVDGRLNCVSQTSVYRKWDSSRRSFRKANSSPQRYYWLNIFSLTPKAKKLQRQRIPIKKIL